MVMGKNTPETVSRHQQHNEEKQTEIEKGLDSIIETTKTGYKKWLEIDTGNYL